MKALTLTLSMAFITASGMIQAATHEHDMSQMATQSATTTITQQGVGIIKAVDTKAGKVQIAHEPIAALDWPAMTMWFALRTSLPQELKAGDGVRFEIAQENGKSWVIVKIGGK